MKQTIEIPEGFELKKISDTEYQIVKKKEKLPNTWEEFCEKYPLKNYECFINNNSNITAVVNLDDRSSCLDKNVLPNKQYAEAVRALCQLIQLRDCYRQGWKPDWNNTETKYSIGPDRNTLPITHQIIAIPFTFSFQTAELRDKFFNNFKELLDTVSYLWR